MAKRVTSSFTAMKKESEQKKEAKGVNALRGQMKIKSVSSFIPESPLIAGRETNYNAAMKDVSKLDEIFSRKRGENITSKRDELSIIYDNRVMPSERLRLFVEAAVRKGFSGEDAVELGLEILNERVLGS